MALAADLPRPYELGDINEHPVAAATTIYEGAAVGDNGSGYARGLVAGDPFLGFCERKVVNSGAAGAKRVRTKDAGRVELSISGLAITDVGKSVYATDDGTFVITGSAGTYIGRVVRYVSSGVGVVAYDVTRRSGSERTFTFPVTLANITGAGDVVTNWTPGFAGRITKVAAIVDKPVTTAAKLATLNLEIGTTNVTGGAVALTSANCTPQGAVVAGSAVTAANVFGATDTISVEAASVTAFAEGEVSLQVTVGP